MTPGRALAKIALVTPRSLRLEAQRSANRIAGEEGFTRAVVYAAQVGRARRIEVVFLVPPDQQPVRTLAEWDEITERVTKELGDDDPNHWITVAYTTKPELL